MNTGLVNRKAAKGKLVQMKLLEKFILADSVSKHLVDAVQVNTWLSVQLLSLNVIASLSQFECYFIIIFRNISQM